MLTVPKFSTRTLASGNVITIEHDLITNYSYLKRVSFDIIWIIFIENLLS